MEQLEKHLQFRGTIYTIVDNSTMQDKVDNGNVNLCTTLVTDMTDVFKDKSSFNSDISFWDTSNVTLMNSMFANILISIKISVIGMFQV